jgi:hypothetical protein
MKKALSGEEPLGAKEAIQTVVCLFDLPHASELEQKREAYRAGRRSSFLKWFGVTQFPERGGMKQVGLAVPSGSLR